MANLKLRHLVKKQLAYTPCRFVLGCIGPSEEISPASSELTQIIKAEVGRIEDILPSQEFDNPPATYFEEMGSQPLSTTIIILKQGGAYTDLQHIKKSAMHAEQRLSQEDNRNFNINPGAVGRYGICLASHKPTGGRHSVSTYAFGLVPQLFLFGEPEVFHERIMSWDGQRLIPLDNKFPEYKTANRIAYFERLVQGLKGNPRPVELFADIR